MAPVCADPRQIVIALEPQRRAELLKLVNDIVLSMTAQLQAKPEELGSVSMESSIYEENTSDEKPKDAASQPAPAQTEQPPSNKPSQGETLFDAEQPPAQNQTVLNSMSKVKFNATNPFKNVKIGVPWKNNPNAPSKASRRAEQLQAAAVKYLTEWQQGFMPKLEEIIRVEDNDKIIAERKNRLTATKPQDDDTIANRAHVTQDGTEIDAAEDLMFLQELYAPVPTALTDLSSNDRREILSCVLLLLLSTGKYSGHSRAMMMHLASSLGLTQTFLNNEESEIAKSLMESSTADDRQKESMSAEAEAAKRRQENKFSRFWKVGLASVAGATIIGVTGGLAAPLVAGTLGGILGGVGLGGVASFLGIFWMNGALVGALFGAYGAKMTGTMMDKYAKEVEDFRFIPLNGDVAKTTDEQAPENQNEVVQTQEPQEKVPDKEDFKDRRLRVTIGVNGWLNSEDDVTRPWQALGSDSEVFALRYEMKTLLSLGTALNELVRSVAWNAFKSEIIKRTVLATLWAALWPIQVVAMASNVDNPFNHASNRSKKAGRLLADALVNKVQGERPVTLVGYSLGANAIHACLQSLAERRAFGLVDTVVIIGTPAPSDAAHWRTLHTVVSGKIFNVYSENDMVLGFVYRMHSLALGVAGLQAIESGAGVENVNLSDAVSGHLRYPELIGKILHRCGFIGIKTGDDVIEKDDVIRMKEEYAAGHIVDLDEDAARRERDAGVATASKDLPGLNVSETANPPLPRRPVANSQPIAPQEEGLISFAEPQFTGSTGQDTTTVPEKANNAMSTGG